MIRAGWPIAAAVLAGCAAEAPQTANGASSSDQEGGRAEQLENVSILPPSKAEAKLSAQPVPARDGASKPGACDTQDGTALPRIRLRAVGTEPFWGARIEGRCVTYSHPDDQSGPRVWTKFSGRAAGGSWSGSLNGRPFSLRTSPEPGCSDGMSDRRYPMAVQLTVQGEERQGCAEPL